MSWAWFFFHFETIYGPIPSFWKNELTLFSFSILFATAAAAQTSSDDTAMDSAAAESNEQGAQNSKKLVFSFSFLKGQFKILRTASYR